MQRVFVMLEQSRYDISAVKYYSKDIVFVVGEERISPFDTSNFVELIIHRLRMEKFDARHDFICLTGSSVLLAIFLAALVREYPMDSQFKVLVYDARKAKYQLRLLNLR